MVDFREKRSTIPKGDTALVGPTTEDSGFAESKKPSPSPEASLDDRGLADGRLCVGAHKPA
jgi:hypothetical protein